MLSAFVSGRAFAVRNGQNEGVLPGGRPGAPRGATTVEAIREGDGAAGRGSHVAKAYTVLRAKSRGRAGASGMAKGFCEEAIFYRQATHCQHTGTVLLRRMVGTFIFILVN